MRFPAACLVLAAALGAGPAAAERLTPERVFASPDLSGPTARGVAFSPDGRLVTYLRPRPDDQTTLDLWAVDAAGGEPRRLIDAAALETGEPLSEAETARRERMRISERGVIQYSWDSQGRQILVPVSGDLYLAQVADGSVRRLTRTPGDEVDAKLSPRGGFVAFTRDGALHAIDLATSAERRLSPVATDTVSWGGAEFIAQEELGRYTGYWISPDDARVAYTRVDEAGVDVIPRFEIGPDGVAVSNQRYPRAGRPNAVVQLFVQPLAGGEPVRVELGADADIYLARVHWSQDGRTLYVQRLSRDQRRLDLLAVDPATGASRTILNETSRHWVNLASDPGRGRGSEGMVPLRDGSFLWTSERSGFNHIYHHRADGRLIRQVTRGDWPVRFINGVDEATGRVIFTASPEDPTQQHAWATSYRALSAPRRFSPEGAPWWSVTLPPSGAAAFVATSSGPDTPPSTALYAPDARRVRWIEENALDADHPFTAYAGRQTLTYGSLRGSSGDRLHTLLITPRNAPAGARLPAIVQVYGGPHAQTVTQNWNGTVLKARLLAEAGFAVLLLDNRGSANRGVAFEAALDRRMGSVEVEDQLAGVAWLRAQTNIDPARIGVMGWSYGGYMTILMMTAPENRIVAGAAGAAPIDWRYYDTGYTERYMGTPQNNLAGYDAGSTLSRLDNLTGRLLLLHGMADDNVTFDNATRLSSALQQRGVVFEQMFYPGQRHGVRPPPLQLHLWRTYLDFFTRTLRPEAPAS